MNPESFKVEIWILILSLRFLETARKDKKIDRFPRGHLRKRLCYDASLLSEEKLTYFFDHIFIQIINQKILNIINFQKSEYNFDGSIPAQHSGA